MKIVFSRKGFDSGSGGGPSPIINGRCHSLPIPALPVATLKSRVSFRERGHAEALALLGSDVCIDSFCHDDPMFDGGLCWLGQCGPAQSHLSNNGVGPGDVFLFFGLFKDPNSRRLEHRIFGYLRTVICAATDKIASMPEWSDPPTSRMPHPHFVDPMPRNDTIWFGTGATNAPATKRLRLTACPTLNRPSLWSVPDWLYAKGLTYHRASHRWKEGNLLQTVGRGQEFVCDIGDSDEPRDWLESVIREIETP